MGDMAGGMDSLYSGNRKDKAEWYGKVPCPLQYFRLWLGSIRYHLKMVGRHLRGLYPRLKCGCWLSCDGHPEKQDFSNMTATEAIMRQQDNQKYLNQLRNEYRFVE
jgi:hypothetical protein